MGGAVTARERLEHIGQTFVLGYHAALDDPEPRRLAACLEEVESEFRGFAYEGAAMALTLLDLLTPWRRDRLAAFLEGAGQAHAYMMHVGAGWAVARLGRDVARYVKGLDPLLRWLVIDGYGFHCGYFSWPRYVSKKEQPSRLSGYARRAFDQGLGRSLWFVCGAEVERIRATVEGFDTSRQADLWSGVGLACAYAGGAESAEVERLRASAGAFRGDLAQGAAFAAKTRERAGNLCAHTEEVCGVLCEMSAGMAARVTDVALGELRDEDGAADEEGVPAYEVWRSAIRRRFLAVPRMAESTVETR